MKISTKGRYAVRLMLDLATTNSKQPVRLKDVAARQGISDKYLDYSDTVFRELRKAGVDVTVDRRPEKIGYKIRDARMEKIPYMLIVGENEAQSTS